jgi:uncharacterized protein (TIGR02217 family)
MHLDAYIEPRTAYGWEGSPNFKTLINDLQNGDEYRNADWIECRHSYTKRFKNLSKEEYRQLKRMFLVCRGMVHAFRTIDSLDNSATDEEFGLGDGSTPEFQLNKISVVDGVEYTRNIYAIRLGTTPTITVDGVPTAAFVVNRRTGRILFDSPPAPGSVLRWSGLFDVWVRFATDSIPFTVDSPDHANGSAGLFEVPAPAEDFTT